MVLLHSNHNRYSHNHCKQCSNNLRMPIIGIDKKCKKQTGHICDNKHDCKHKKAEIRLLGNFAACWQSALKVIVLDRVGSIRRNKYAQQIEGKNTKADANGIEDESFYGILLESCSVNNSNTIQQCLLQIDDSLAIFAAYFISFTDQVFD